jgi:hypothetical protein
MFGHNVLDCNYPRLSYDNSGSVTNYSIAIQCNNCYKMGSVEPNKLEEAGKLDTHLCDDCADNILNDMMD